MMSHYFFSSQLGSKILLPLYIYHHPSAQSSRNWKIVKKSNTIKSFKTNTARNCFHKMTILLKNYDMKKLFGKKLKTFNPLPFFVEFRIPLGFCSVQLSLQSLCRMLSCCWCKKNFTFEYLCIEIHYEESFFKSIV